MDYEKLGIAENIYLWTEDVPIQCSDASGKSAVTAMKIWIIVNVITASTASLTTTIQTSSSCFIRLRIVYLSLYLHAARDQPANRDSAFIGWGLLLVESGGQLMNLWADRALTAMTVPDAVMKCAMPASAHCRW